MNRADPFFATRTPHTKPYLESLHRTYGEPVGALPKRNDQAFQRALAFREQEKDKYKKMEEENRFLAQEYSKIRMQSEEMASETKRIQELYEKLSKDLANNEQRSDRGTSSDGSVPERLLGAPSGANASVLHGANDRGRPGAGLRDPRSDEDPAAPASRSDERVQEQVLPPERLPDLGGHAKEHATDGPEPGNGARDGETNVDGASVAGGGP